MPVGFGDLLQRFQAVDGETRTQHLDVAHALARQLLERFVGVRHEPGLAADTRLERDAALICADAELLAQTQRRDHALAVSYTHLRAHETPEHLVCRLLLEKK